MFNTVTPDRAMSEGSPRMMIIIFLVIVVDAAFSEQCMYIRRCCLSVITGSCTNINVIKIIILKKVKQYSIFLEWNDLKM